MVDQRLTRYTWKLGYVMLLAFGALQCAMCIYVNVTICDLHPKWYYWWLHLSWVWTRFAIEHLDITILHCFFQEMWISAHPGSFNANRISDFYRAELGGVTLLQENNLSQLWGGNCQITNIIGKRIFFISGFTIYVDSYIRGRAHIT